MKMPVSVQRQVGQAIRLPRHGRRNRLPHLSPDVPSITYDLFSEEHRLESLCCNLLGRISHRRFVPSVEIFTTGISGEIGSDSLGNHLDVTL